MAPPFLCRLWMCGMLHLRASPSKACLMWQLFHYPLCPFSRTIRLILAEKRIAHSLVQELPWERRPEFLSFNHASQTPVLHWAEDAATMPEARSSQITLSDCSAITEYLEETVQDAPLMGSGPLERAEVRRIAGWFHQKYFAECGVLLLQERMYNRIVARASPDTQMIRTALNASELHMSYIDHLVDRRRWLAGNSFTLADMAAAAHVSVADYLGGVNWDKHEPAKQWYMAIKSRPAFRPLLADRMQGLAPPPHYEKLDF
jgi:glutathione S-transferase